MAGSEKIVVFCGAGRVNRLANLVLRNVNNSRPGEKDLNLSNINFGFWSDGEPDDRIATPAKISGRHAVLFVNCSTTPLVTQALQLMWAIKRQYKAESLTVVMPFMSYRRQDHPEVTHEIHRNLWFMEMLKANGVDRLIVCDVHSDQTRKNAEKIDLVFFNVDPTPAYAKAMFDLVSRLRGELIPTFIDAPDKGSIPRAASLAKELNLPILFDLKKFKTRSQTGKITMDKEADEQILSLIKKVKQDYGVESVLMKPDLVSGSVVISREDELDTGGTAAMRGRWYREMGVAELYLAVTHLVLSPGWRRNITDNSPYTHIFGGNTIYRSYEKSTGGLIKDVDMSLVIGSTLNSVLNLL
ncbi:MAG TPA: ribose-phosphate pyrophosphokinase-like domain-containing protein [Patescibacteria group bacterium]|nr:ribose-phosphate pyrophosphokinase-like domain-containing protein [Patescibacteria group bacterium]